MWCTDLFTAKTAYVDGKIVLTEFPFIWCPPEVSNGVSSAGEYMENGYDDYYTNQGISH